MKKTLLLPLFLICLGAPVVVAQLPAASATHNLTLDVQNKGAGGATKSSGGGIPNPGANNNNNNNQATSTSTQTKNHSTTLGITIRSLDKTPDNVQVEWYFFARKVQNYHVKNESLFDSGTKTISLPATGSSTFDVTSKVAQTTKSTKVTATNNNNNNGTNANQNVSYNSTESQSGTEISGWVVRLVVDGKVVDARGSEFKYEDAAKDPDKFAALKAGK